MVNKIIITSFDIGKKNFAFVIEEIDLDKLKFVQNIPKNIRYNSDGLSTSIFNKTLSSLYQCGKVLLFRNLDLTGDCNKKAYLDPKIFFNMNTELDKYKKYWDKCSIFIIEKQMAFKGKRNTMALKLGQHCFSYFIFNYGVTKKTIEFSAYYKTQILGAQKKLTKPQRKKWAIEKALSILAEREDYENLTHLNTVKKKDDISDCILMNIAYTFMHLL